MPGSTLWTIRTTGNSKFPYRLTITQGKEVLLDLVTQDKWPGTKGNIFCLRASGGEEKEEEIVDEATVVTYKGYGKKLNVVLDRPKKKRCGFLFLTRSYKNKPGEYEQIFWQTQQGLSQRRPKYKLAYNKKEYFTVFVDSGERYSWKFPGARTVKEQLPAGDYAVKDESGILAVVERKTLNNLISELGNLGKFHQHLSELESCRRAAVVIEADYSDLLNKEKIRPYTGYFVAKAMGQIQSCHPDLPVIFAGSRKSAVIWAHYFFSSVSARQRDEYTDVIKESTAKYGQDRSVLIEDELRRAALSRLPEEFTTRQLRDAVPRARPVAARRVLEKIKQEGRLTSEKRGRDLVWKRNNDSG